MAILKKGLVQVYTGNGKGKTTAALGLVWRMLGWGGRVYVCQFLKPAELQSGEVSAAKAFGERLVFDRLDVQWDMANADSDSKQLSAMQKAVAAKLVEIKRYAQAGLFDLMVLDELAYCLSKGIARWEDVSAIIHERKENIELVLTGCDAPKELIEKADLVSEMKEIKHPYNDGLAGRKGIEY